jgi:NTP pyrophosphatase (non-canonical NTP hydrolase)
MEFDDYQREAEKTDQMLSGADGKRELVNVIVPLLGLAGETGEILSEYKKFLRDGPAHKLFKARLVEELGDLLWYLSSAAAKFDISLEEVAHANLAKCRARWEAITSSQMSLGLPRPSFDSGYPLGERLPRKRTIEFATVETPQGLRTLITSAGEQFGNELSDNRDEADGYRFHDVFHLAYAAVLGWSPITRKFFNAKRRSDARVDEVQDGGRATVIEEGIAALIFSYAEQHEFLEGLESVDYDLLRTIAVMTSHLEVSARSAGQWEDAILQGFAVWRRVKAANSGRVVIDLDQAKISFLTES